MIGFTMVTAIPSSTPTRRIVAVRGTSSIITRATAPHEQRLVPHAYQST